jgi:hypothetical protein
MHLERRATRQSLFALITVFIAAGIGPSVRIHATSVEQVGVVREGQTTTTLTDGRILVVGGDENGTCEIYDPASGRTTLLDARPNVARAYHSALLLADGNVLIVGGYSAGGGSVERSAETFSVPTGRFVKVAGSTRAARVQPAMTLRDDGIVRIVGGDAAGSTEFYDPATQTFGPDPAAASVTTDRPDYAPGETVTFTGRRWAAGETVRLLLDEEPPRHGAREIFATADGSGDFINSDFAPEEHDLGVTFHVTATGLTSGRQALWIFTDGAPASTGYTISSSTGRITAGGTDIGSHCDDCVTPITLPFPVTLYDQTFTTAAVSANGTVLFNGALAGAYANSALPTRAFEMTILPYWDDLRTDGTGHGIFTQTTGEQPDRVFHIRFNTVYFTCATAGCVANFELLLYESLAQFDVIYGSFSGTGSATIGVQRSSRGPSTWYLNSASVNGLASGTVLRFGGVPVHATTTSLKASVNPSMFGQSTTLTATVISDGSPVTTGTVTFTAGETRLAGPIAVSASGEASFTTSLLPATAHVIAASYTCMSTWGGSSAAITQTVSQARTSTEVPARVNPIVFGQPATVTAYVNPVSPGSGTPTGTVQFQADGANVAEPVTVVGGRADLTFSSLSVGSHTISASYSGDASFMVSSGSASQTVNRADTTTSVAAMTNPSVYGETASFAVTVAAVSPGSGTPEGTVQFRDNGTDLGPPVTLSRGSASVAVTSLLAGAHTITAEYAGDSGFNRSTSGRVFQTVDRATATITLSGLSWIYDGSPRTATAATEPADLGGVSITYDGSAAPPTDAGSYTVVASLDNRNYQAASAMATLHILPARQFITFDPLEDKTYGDPAFLVSARASSDLTVTFTAAGSCSVSGAMVTLMSAGLCTVTAEQRGNRNYEAAPIVSRRFDVAYTWSNVLRPVNVDGTSIFKLGSAVPVKFQLTGASAALTNLAARIYVAPVRNGEIGLEIRAISAAAADSGNMFRYDSSSGQYLFNLATTALTPGTWRIRIDLLDQSPVPHTVVISLK